MHRQGHSRWYVQAHSVPFANHTWLFFEARITHTCVQSTNQKLDLGKWLLQALKADLSHLGKRCWDPGCEAQKGQPCCGAGDLTPGLRPPLPPTYAGPSPGTKASQSSSSSPPGLLLSPASRLIHVLLQLVLTTECRG